jgi:hypothetical protein
MRKNILYLLACLYLIPAFGQTKPDQPVRSAGCNILLSGASFASSDNRWFEMGCALLNATAINRAIGGEAIADAANRMITGDLYTQQELETLDAFVIMQVHDRNVADESGLLENYREYKTPFNRDNYAAAFDYVIKRYTSECYELRDNPQSKYYGSKTGKPAVIILCTDWHDARTTYNTTVRRLAEKWGLPLVEFDKYIGFSKNKAHPVTNQQYSLIYAADTQVIDNVTYGWHPLRGDDSFIQQRMAAIFADLMRKILYPEL